MVREPNRKPIAYLKAQASAEHKAREAIASGYIERTPCEICGKTPTHAHHDDYNKPLQVRFLCPSCHKKWHNTNEPIRVSGEKECGICQRKFIPDDSHWKFCSDECRKESQRRINKPYTQAHTARKTMKAREKRIQIPRTCPECNTVFYSSDGMNKKYCSTHCAKEARKRQKREEYARNGEKYRISQIKRMQDPAKKQRKKEMDRVYREKHKEKLREYSKKYYHSKKVTEKTIEQDIVKCLAEKKIFSERNWCINNNLIEEE